MLSLLWSLVEVHSPLLSLMGQTLANHSSNVDLSLVGRSDVSDGDDVQHITDLSSCTNIDGCHRGDQYFPNGTRLPFASHNKNTFEVRGTQRVNIGANSPTGIYHCDILTNAVHDGTDISVRDTVYVGLYTDTGGMCCLHLSHRPTKTEGSVYTVCAKNTKAEAAVVDQ